MRAPAGLEDEAVLGAVLVDVGRRPAERGGGGEGGEGEAMGVRWARPVRDL